MTASRYAIFAHREAFFAPPDSIHTNRRHCRISIQFRRILRRGVTIMIHRGWQGLLLVTVVGLGWSLVRGETKSPAKSEPAPESALMRAKVASSHKIMEGLVSKDFLEIRSGA